MKQVVLDTETTGLDPGDGHRIIEIGCVELIDRRPTDNHFHRYLCPDRPIDPGATQVHGITDAMLADKPRFADIADDLIRYLEGCELIIHNAPFDVGFLDREFERGDLDRRTHDLCTVVDTLVMARRVHPGQKNSLDALCRRYGVDNSNRELHGALLDARLLADVYLAMTGGQANLLFQDDTSAGGSAARPRIKPDRPALRVLCATAAEQDAHRAMLELIARESGGECVWIEQADPAPT